MAPHRVEARQDELEELVAVEADQVEEPTDQAELQTPEAVEVVEVTTAAVVLAEARES